MSDRIAHFRAIVAKHHIPVSHDKTIFTIRDITDVHSFHNRLFAGVDTHGFLVINIPITITVITPDIHVQYFGAVIIFQHHVNKRDIFILNNEDGVEMFKRGVFRNLSVIERLLDGCPIRNETSDRIISIVVAV